MNSTDIYQTPAYVYKITNKTSGTFYIGYRYATQKRNILPENDIWVIYFTSSKTVKTEIEKVGKDNFDVQILLRNQDSNVCWTYEQILIKENWENPLLLNNRYHDADSDFELKRRVRYATEDTRLKMSKAGKGRPKSEEWKKKMSILTTGQYQSQEKRDKISQSNKDKVMVIDTFSNKKCKITKEEFDLNPERYMGQTKGKISAYNLLTNKYVSVSKDEFYNNRDVYVGVKSKITNKPQP